MKLKSYRFVLRLVTLLILAIVYIAFSNNLISTQPTILEEGEYDVTEVVDGDTVKIDFKGTEETVRLIGVDTPETKHPNQPIECFGQEATDKLSELLEGHKIKVEFDTSQSKRDRYNRLLIYIYRSEDNLFINKYMIEEGYAFEYTYEKPYKYQREFQNAELNARTGRNGLWSENCDY